MIPEEVKDMPKLHTLGFTRNKISNFDMIKYVPNLKSKNDIRE